MTTVQLLWFGLFLVFVVGVALFDRWSRKNRKDQGTSYADYGSNDGDGDGGGGDGGGD